MMNTPHPSCESGNSGGRYIYPAEVFSEANPVRRHSSW
jgi:hypothetical protein